ncbi:hypothetical protein, partial [Pseudorhizobium halotolerans]|uniref:hypothetical protein n=1 Tax=Pseudorhizobium halotolerans TaxID=1233081 RepID=UPI001B7D3A10
EGRLKHGSILNGNIRLPRVSSQWKSTARLLAEHGRLAVDIRDPMPGEPIGIFHAHREASILEAAIAAELACIDYAERSDALGRPEYFWRSYVFSHATV